ncbi:MAG: hypothetical protein AABZ60_03550 [Planctomycetota bacterium]
MMYPYLGFLFFIALSWNCSWNYAQDIYKIEYGATFCGYLESITLETPEEVKFQTKSFFIDVHEDPPVLLQQTEQYLFDAKLEPISLQIIQKTATSEKKYLCARDPAKIVLITEEKENNSTQSWPNTGQKIWPNMFVIAQYLKRFPIEQPTEFKFFDMLDPKTEFLLAVSKLGTKRVKTDLGEIDCFHFKLEFRLGFQIRTQTLLLSQKDYTLIQFVDLGPDPHQSTRIQITHDTIKTEAQEFFKKLRVRQEPKDLNWFFNRTFQYDFSFGDQKFGTHSFTLKKGEAMNQGVYILEGSTTLKTEQKDIQSQSTTIYNQMMLPLSYKIKSKNQLPKENEAEMEISFEASEVRVLQKINTSETSKIWKSPSQTSLLDHNQIGQFAMLCTKVELEEGSVTSFQIFHPFKKEVFEAKVKVLDEVLDINGTYYLCDLIAEPLEKIRLIISSKHELLEYRQNLGLGQMVVKLQK